MYSVKEAVEQFKRRLLAREAAEMARMAKRWGQIRGDMERELQRLTETIAGIRGDGKEVSAAMLRRQEDYRRLLRRAAARHAEFSQYAGSLIATEQRGHIDQGIEDASAVLEKSGVHLGFGNLDVRAVEAMAGLLGDGSPVRDALMRRFPANWETAERMLLHGLAMGWNPRKTAQQMSKALGGVLSDALVIARTEQLRAYREASRNVYEESGVVKQYKRMAAHDTRTCAACLVMDGRMYPVQEPLNDHPCGRCAMVPVVLNRPEPQWQTGEQWFESLPDEDQRKILGPGKFAAFKEATFDFAQLAKTLDDPIWGRQVRTAGLTELVGGAAAVQDLTRLPWNDPTIVAALAADRVDMTNLAQGDQALKVLRERQGFSKLPRVVDSLEGIEGREIYRGLSDRTYCEAYKYGEHYPGVGLVGNGDYWGWNQTGPDAGYVRALEYSAGDPEHNLLRGKLSPDARVAGWETLSREVQRELERLAQERARVLDAFHEEVPKMTRGDAARRAVELMDRYEQAAYVYSDPGRYAVMKGYDAFLGIDNEIIILNRGKVIVER